MRKRGEEKEKGKYESDLNRGERERGGGRVRQER